MTTVKIIKYPTDDDWLRVKNDALLTANKVTTKIPDTKWKTKILASEHSPIRDLSFVWDWYDLPYWVSVHFVRHSIGISHFCQSQRNDILGTYDRNKAPQDSLVVHRCVANAQSIINISKVRLCKKASPETTHAWILFLKELYVVTPELVKLCVPTCIYRNGICPEFTSCGFFTTPKFRDRLMAYRVELGLENK